MNTMRGIATHTAARPPSIARAASIAAAVGIIAACALPAGCVRRTITITSEPAGALVWLNEREVGRTPVTVDFTYYGRYDVQLERDGYEPRMTSAVARAPLWDLPGPDFFAELVPVELHSRTEWHFDLTPRDDRVDHLLDRADDLRRRLPDPPSQSSESGDM